MQLDLWFILVTTIFVASIIPGPSVLFCLRSGYLHGKKKSLASALGITTAAIIMGFISLIGLGAVLVTSGVIFQIIKYAGAGYLVYMGIRMWKDRTEHNNEENNVREYKNGNFIKLYLQAMVVGFSNPKAIIFFTALFPQFINQSGNQITQFSVILSSLAITCFICMMIYIFCGNILSPVINRKKTMNILNKITGGLFISFGLGLAVSEID